MKNITIAVRIDEGQIATMPFSAVQPFIDSQVRLVSEDFRKQLEKDVEYIRYEHRKLKEAGLLEEK